MLTGRGLQAKAAATLAPASLDADVRLIGDVLSLKAKLQQPSFSPVEVAGNLPLPLKQVVQNKQIDPLSPVQLSIRLPKTSMAVLTRLVPAIRYLEGTAAISVDVAGTVGKPLFNGSALIDLPAIRFTARNHALHQRFPRRPPVCRATGLPFASSAGTSPAARWG